MSHFEHQEWRAWAWADPMQKLFIEIELGGSRCMNFEWQIVVRYHHSHSRRLLSQLLVSQSLLVHWLYFVSVFRIDVHPSALHSVHSALLYPVLPPSVQVFLDLRASADPSPPGRSASCMMRTIATPLRPPLSLLAAAHPLSLS